jgi:hypothetical protein
MKWVFKCYIYSEPKKVKFIVIVFTDFTTMW